MVRKITKAFAETVYKNTPELHLRSVNSIVERLPYLDNFLAWTLEIQNYYLKDQPLFGLSLSESKDK